MAALEAIGWWRAALARRLTAFSAEATSIRFAGTKPVCLFDAVPFTAALFRRAADQFDFEIVAQARLAAGGRGSKGGCDQRASTPATVTSADVSPNRFLDERQRELEAITIPDTESRWTGYYRVDVPLGDKTHWNPKQMMAAESLGIAKPQTVLDLGSNTGWYSRLAASGGARVIAVDADEHCVNRLYRDAAGENTEILPVVLNLAKPTPARGGARPLPCALERFPAEMVIAMALSHHLILSDLAWGFEQVAALFSRLARRYLLTEFVSLAADSGNPYGTGDRPGCEAWYTLDGFRAALSTHFNEVVLLPSWPPGRNLLFCER